MCPSKAHSHISMGHLVVPVASQRSTSSPSCSACFCRLCLSFSRFSPIDSSHYIQCLPHDIVAVCLSLTSPSPYYPSSVSICSLVQANTKRGERSNVRLVLCNTGRESRGMLANTDWENICLEYRLLQTVIGRMRASTNWLQFNQL